MKDGLRRAHEGGRVRFDRRAQPRQAVGLDVPGNDLGFKTSNSQSKLVTINMAVACKYPVMRKGRG